MASGTSSTTASEQLRDSKAFDPFVIARGELLALSGAVTVLEGSPERVFAVVRGTLPYEVSLVFDRRGGSPYLLVACTCADAANRAACRHVWAALRVAERKELLRGSRGQATLAVGSLLTAADEGRASAVRWVIDLSKTSEEAPAIEVFEQSTTSLGFSSGFRKLSFSQHGAERGLFPSGKFADVARLSQTRRCDVLTDRRAMSDVLEIDEGPAFSVILRVLDGGPVEVGMPSLVVRGELRREEQRIPLEALTRIYRSGVAFMGPLALPVESDVPFRWTSVIQREGELRIDASESLAFLRELVRKAKATSFELPACVAVEERSPLVTRVRVQRPESADPNAMVRKLETEITFDYGGAKIAQHERGGLAVELSGRRIVKRDPEAEQRALATLVAVGFDRVRDRERGHTLKIATSRLRAAIVALPPEEFVVEALGVVHRRPSRTALRIHSGLDWFDLDAVVEFDGIAISTPALLEAAERGDGLIRLGDGTMGVLPESWLARVARVMNLGVALPNERAAEGLRFRRAQLTLVDALLGEGELISWDGPLATLREELATFAGLPPAETPRGFRGELREYQRAGLAWLQWLERIGFSGCLADDMGLGKTVQVLALLADRRERGQARGPALIVAPRSVVFNWLDEARRFAPGLRACELTSQTTEDDARTCDLLVTTYGVMRRRIDALKAWSFDYVVLDEAQAIKNEKSSTAAAARALHAERRLALTGTPVENHLGELASLFAFLNPGMMGEHVRATVAAGFDLDPETAARLGRGLRPFVLRRRKSDVLRELPPRVDQALVCTMSSEQRAVYDRVKKHYQAQLLAKGQSHVTISTSPLVVLEALLRLRQIACHPGLVDPALRGQRSAKLDVLAEHLEPLVRDGKKAIVFSQFTSLLDLVGLDLAARGITFGRLDGATTNRKSVVEAFQHDPSCQVFLVSLKAGGVGLNLTAAEYVFLLDPWWNPAAEAQAIDRAHRYGQQKTVIAYRLVCKDSIDERVAELQEKKRALVASVFSETEGLRLGALSVSDVEALLS